MTKKIEIVQVLDPPSNRPFFLVETYQTSDGLRTRVCGNRWKSLSEAMHEQAERMKNATVADPLAVEAQALAKFEEWKKDFEAKQRSAALAARLPDDDDDLPGVMRGS